MNINTFLSVAPNLPSEIAILMRGPTGIGKSHLGRRVSEMLSLPFIDVRGSTMSEGDIGGYPDIEGMKETGVMTFCMPSWFIRACSEPVVICLDELNRSLPGVQQGFFQLILDRELGNDKNGMPYRLHPETRIIACVNHGAEYDVNDMDPALLRRFWVCDVEATVDSWSDWARDNDIDSLMIDFVSQNPEHFRVDPSQIESGTVAPNPASWHRVDMCMKHMGIPASQIAGAQRPSSLYPLCMGMLGSEAAIAFCDFIENYTLVISAEDILDRYKEKLEILEVMKNDRLNDVIDKLKHNCKDNEWTLKQSKNVAKFADLLPGEMMVSLWNSISSTQNLPNIQKMHKLIGQRVVKAVQSSRKVSKS